MSRRRTPLLLLLGAAALSICVSQPAAGQPSDAPPAPPTDLTAQDHPWDKGEKIDLRWQLSPDDPDTIAGYRIYRSLTVKDAAQLDFEDRVEDLVDLFEEPDLPPEQLKAAIEARLPDIRAWADSAHAKHYEYDYQAEEAAAALEAYLAAGMDDRTMNRRAGKALSVLEEAIPLSERQQQDEELEAAAERVAKTAVTEPILRGLFGERWKEIWEERADEIPTDIRAQLYELRYDAELEAERRAQAAAAAKGDDVRWKHVVDVEPGLLEIRAGEMGYTLERLDRFSKYVFKVTAIGDRGVESGPTVASSRVRPVRQVYDGARFALMVITLLICGSVVFFIRVARSGKPLNVRKIAGLSAVDEAVGRATEMGRSVLFVAGIQDMNDIQTIAGITVLSRVSRLAAEYDAKIEVPTARSLVMTAARETVQASYLEAGRPDAFNADNIYYVTDEQFGFVAYLQGMMVREKPAACFYMGTFFAESLILAETGNSIGAIQIAGTAMPAQLPFFVAACDYTLIGEEFFAASAYLSGEPDQLGSLKGQDVGKLIVGIIVVIGVLLATALSVAILANEPVTAAYLEAIIEFIRKVVLT
ncbi:MAG: DUF6754 domain-containing protein [Planctomycetota bacterium]|nr:DUF6754 domain-containing protein [Planctomycetota bacterium]